MNDNKIILPTIADGEDKTSPLRNRIRKNYRHLRKWGKRTSTDCFRIYDRDIKEYPVTIDFYAGRFCVQYRASHRDDVEPPEDLIKEVETALESIFEATADAIYWRSRIRRKKTQQYEKLDYQKEFFIAHEYG